MVSPWVRIRRNHALEHATVAVMVQRRGRRIPVVGISSPAGFILAGGFDPAEADVAASEALRRLQDGQQYLAVSDDCGTSLLVNAILSTSVVLAVTRRNALARLPMAITAAIAVGRIAPQIGRSLQRALTTDARLEATAIRRVWTARLPRGLTLAHISVEDAYEG